MKTSSRQLYVSWGVAFFFLVTLVAFAQEKPTTPPAPEKAPPADVTPATPPPASTPAPVADVAPATPAAPETAPAAEKETAPASQLAPATTGSDDDKPAEPAKPTPPGKKKKNSHGPTIPKIPAIPHVRIDRNHNGNEVVSIGHDSFLAKDAKADAVVSVLGSSTSEGEVADAVVSVMGNTRVTGPVGDAAVAVMGDVYVNSHVRGEVVAVMGDVELGPEAEVDGEIVSVGGVIKRDPKAITHGQVNNVSLGRMGTFPGLRAWFDHCVRYARPLAVAPGLAWAWGIAFGFLGFYLLLSLLFRSAVEKCAQTLEERPGYSLLATLLTVLLTPVAIIILCITIIGIAVVPFAAAAIFALTLFGKVVMLAWLGRRITKLIGPGPFAHPVFAVLIGGLIVMALYTIPIIGVVVYKLLGVLGYGVTVYTIILGMKREKPAAPRPTAPTPGPTPGQYQTQTPFQGQTQGSGLSQSQNLGATAPSSQTASAFAPMAGEIPSSGAGTMSPGFVGSSSIVNTDTNPGLGATFTAEAGTGGGSTASVPPMAPPPPPVPPVMSAATLPRVGFWLRFAASLLDAMLVSVAVEMIPHLVRPNFMLVYATYCVVFWALKGTTLGGIVCSLKVVRLDQRPLDWSVAVVRGLGGFLSFMVVGLGFIWVAFDDEQQSWHDKIAGTTIVRMPKGVSLL